MPAAVCIIVHIHLFKHLFSNPICFNPLDMDQVNNWYPRKKTKTLSRSKYSMRKIFMVLMASIEIVLIHQCPWNGMVWCVKPQYVVIGLVIHTVLSYWYHFIEYHHLIMLHNIHLLLPGSYRWFIASVFSSIRIQCCVNRSTNSTKTSTAGLA